MINIPDSFFPKNDEGAAICPKCKLVLQACVCPSFDPTKPRTDQFSPQVRLDKSGRHGKLVTLINGLPQDDAYLKDLAKKIKVRTGSGGTSYLLEDQGVVEIQGDQRKLVVQILRDEKFMVKISF